MLKYGVTNGGNLSSVERVYPCDSSVQVRPTGDLFQLPPGGGALCGAPIFRLSEQQDGVTCDWSGITANKGPPRTSRSRGKRQRQEQKDGSRKRHSILSFSGRIMWRPACFGIVPKGAKRHKRGVREKMGIKQDTSELPLMLFLSPKKLCMERLVNVNVTLKQELVLPTSMGKYSLQIT